MQFYAAIPDDDNDSDSNSGDDNGNDSGSGSDTGNSSGSSDVKNLAVIDGIVDALLSFGIIILITVLCYRPREVAVVRLIEVRTY